MKIAPVFNIRVHRKDNYRCAQFDMGDNDVGDKKDCPYLDEVSYEKTTCTLFQKSLISSKDKAPRRCNQCLNSKIVS